MPIELLSHPFLKSFLSQPPKQIKSVVSSLISQSSRLSGVRPSSRIFFSLVVSGWRSLSLLKLYRSLDSISRVYSLVKATSVSVRLRINSFRLKSANSHLRRIQWASARDKEAAQRILQNRLSCKWRQTLPNPVVAHPDILHTGKSLAATLPA